jgi:phenylacetate-CoA ligase
MVIIEEQEEWKQFTPQNAKKQEDKLKNSLADAFKSPLYRKLWKNSKFTVDQFESLSDLNFIPFLNRTILFETTRALRDKVCTGPVSHWFLGHEPSETHEWFPYSEEDLMGMAPLLGRMSRTVGLRKGDIVLAVVDTPPRISSFVPYLWTRPDASRGCELEFIIGSLDWYDVIGMSWINFIQKRRPTAIFSSVTNAQALAQKIFSSGVTLRDALSEVRLGIFYGNPADDGLSRILQPYSFIESFEAYSPSEQMSFCCECKSHSGIHLWSDISIFEIIPAGHKEAQLVRESKAGTIGELVITNFSRALPLIRYKTGKTIYVEGVDECACGCNHPKVRFDSKI